MKNLRRMCAAAIAAVTAASCLTAVVNAESEEYKLLVSPISADVFKGEVGATDTGFFSVTDEDIANWQKTGEFTYSELTADFELPEIISGFYQKENIAWINGKETDEQPNSLRVLNYDPEAKTLTTKTDAGNSWSYVNLDGTFVALDSNDEAKTLSVTVTSAEGKSVTNTLEFKGEGNYFYNCCNVYDNPKYACAVLWVTDFRKVNLDDSGKVFFTQYAFDIYLVTKDGKLETVTSYTFDNSEIVDLGYLNSGDNFISWTVSPMARGYWRGVYPLDSKERIVFNANSIKFNDGNTLMCNYRNGTGNARIDYIKEYRKDAFVAQCAVDYTTDPVEYRYILGQNKGSTFSPLSKDYKSMSSSDGKIFLVQTVDDKWGYIDANGKELGVFDDAGTFEGEYAPVVKDGKAYLIDRSMNRVSEMIDADGVRSIEGNDQMFMIKKGDKRYLATFALPAPEKPSDTSTSSDTSSDVSDTSSDTGDTSNTSTSSETQTSTPGGSSGTSGKDNPPTGAAFGVMLTLTAIAGAVAVVSRKKR